MDAVNSMSFLEVNMLTAPSGSSTADKLPGALFQISMLPAIRVNKASSKAVRAVAFIPAESDLDDGPQTIAEDVSAWMDSQFRALKEEMNLFVMDAEARAEATAAELKS